MLREQQKLYKYDMECFTWMDLLKKLRKDIDRSDEVIITALAQRMSYMPDIGEYKKEHNIPVFQEKREQEIMKRLKGMARMQGLSEEFVEEVFLSIFNEAKRIQQDAMNKEEE